VAWILAKRTGTLSAGVRVLIAIEASVGVGSILWHACPVLPIGTHFLWHILIGLVTYLAMRPLILGTAMGGRARVR
jgi:hypothetical protein